MDPDATLRRVREIIANMEAHDTTTEELCELAQLVDALDQWLSGGGFLPVNWRRLEALQCELAK